MPVRFRCAYCNQLLGISRRKIGTVVRCPTCAGQVVVPPTDTEGPSAAPAPAPAPAQARQPLFEQNDFADLFNAPAPAPAPVPASTRSKAKELEPVAIDPGVDVEPIDLDPMPGKAPGIILTPLLATVLAVGVILALAVAFGAGLLVGKAIWS